MLEADLKLCRPAAGSNTFDEVLGRVTQSGDHAVVSRSEDY